LQFVNRFRHQFEFDFFNSIESHPIFLKNTLSKTGAGKTETAKIVMHYLATVVSRTDQNLGSNIQEKVLNANPILESFGNAQTLRNVNSSRFGKYNQMYFNGVGTLVGSAIQTYLLESSRVCVQNDGERNYHIFYELLAGCGPKLLREFELDDSQVYKMLSPGDTTKKTPENDTKNFQEISRALETVGFSSDETKTIFQIIASLIHLGEFRFAVKDMGETTGMYSF